MGAYAGCVALAAVVVVMVLAVVLRCYMVRTHRVDLSPLSMMQVTYHVNITDVDDKIIKRARRNKLIADLLAEHTNDASAGESLTVC